MASAIPLSLLLLVPVRGAGYPCESCHPKEVQGYARSGMARSLRRAGAEPQGTFTTDSGTKFTIHAARGTSRQVM